jgi:hypothetical protein
MRSVWPRRLPRYFPSRRSQGADRHLVLGQRPVEDEVVARGVPESDRAVVVPGDHEARVGPERQSRHPGRLRDGGQHVAAGRVPDRQVVAGGREDPGVGAEPPQGFHVAQGVPLELAAGLGVPPSQDPRLLHREEVPARGEGEQQHLAVGVQLGLAEDMTPGEDVGGLNRRGHVVLRRRSLVEPNAARPPE